MAAPVKGLGCVVRNYESKSFDIEELTFAAPGPNELRLKICACGVCQSDVSMIKGYFPNTLPCVLGHEGSGIVESVGEGIDDWKVGDHAILTLTTACGLCASCLDGKPWLCDDKTKYAPVGKVTDNKGALVTAFQQLGCMAEYVVVHKSAVIHVEKDVPLEKAALISCGVSTGAGAAINKAKVHPGSTCCVFGCGGVGLNVIQGARICGAAQIIAVDTNPSKLSAAKFFGATHTVNAKEVKNVPREVLSVSNSKIGADYCFECIGQPTTVENAIKATKRGGTMIGVGIGSMADNIKFKLNVLPTLEKNITGAIMGSAPPQKLVPMLVSMYKSGQLKIGELISKYYKVADAHAAFDELYSGANLRGVVVMNDLEVLAEVPRAFSKL